MSARKNRTYHALQIAAHKYQKIADREIASATQLTTSQAAVLSVLTATKARNQKAIAEELGQNESAITDMVRKLIRMGYVDRRRNRLDGRAWELVITPDGETTLKEARGPFAKINKIIDSELSPREVDELTSMLNRLVSRLESVE